MRSYAFFNSICGAVCVCFILGIFLVFRSASARDYIPLEVVEINNVPTLEKREMRNESNSPFFISNQKLPDKINLAVPFTSQAPEKNWEEPWQDACEEAAVLMLDAYYKGYNLSPLFARDEILKMVAWEDSQGWAYSIPIEKVKDLAEKFQISNPSTSSGQVFKFQIVVNPTIDQIKRSIAAGHPVLAVAHGKALPNPYFRNGGPEYHALIIRGYTEDSFITNDPGTWRGENFVYKYEELMNAVRDWNNGNVKEGRKVVLMLAGVTDL